MTEQMINTATVMAGGLILLLVYLVYLAAQRRKNWPRWVLAAALALSAAIGIALNFTPVDPIQALYWSAVINGVLAVPVMVLLMFMARRKDVMGRFVVGGPLYWLGWLSTLAMLLSVVAMGVGFFV
jgi:Mn2+/Fe2+ NRAMP family transporter